MTYTIAATIFILVASTSCSDDELFQENGSDVTRLNHEEKVPIDDATGVAGSIARLPCDLSTKLPGDKVHLVLWYKEGHGAGVGVRVPLIPVYSFDSRGQEDEEPQHWSDVATFGGRAHFHQDDKPAALAIDSVRDRDSGVYRCRVDFKRSPTRNSRVNLTIIIPPERLSVVDSNGVHIQHYILGPYFEGASLDIACIATGGRPMPRVTWWQENALLDDSWEVLAERSVRNVLKIDRLERRHLHTVFTCQASNNNIVAPISSAVTLDLNLSPLWVRLLGVNKPVSAGQSQEARCESVGGRPAPHITWWKGSQLLPNSTQETSADGNRTVSTLRYTPTIDDSAAILKCRATSPAHALAQVQLNGEPPLEDTWSLNVRHLPVVSLEMGGDGNARFVREGSDVSLECIVRANPWVYRVTWKQNGRLLYDNGYNNGVILNNQSLTIRNVSRSHTGYYSCTASNQEGDGESDQFYLSVKFAPVCRPGQQTVIGAARLEPVQVSCEVEADPDDVTFTWSHSVNKVTDDMLKFDVERTRSTAVITPMTSSDFGNMSCWASNVLGKQKQPCVFQLVSAGRPEAVSNCSVLNQTDDGLSLEVWCEAGFDGGLGQSFQLELYDGDSLQLLRNLTSPSAPHFLIDPLPAADSRRLDLRVYAFNDKGRSMNVTLRVYNSNKAERRIAAVTVKLTPLIGALIGMVGALILIILAVALALYLRNRECPPPNKQKAPSLESLENNPDIITNCDGHETEDEKDFDKLLQNVKEKPNDRRISATGDALGDRDEEDSILKSSQSPSCPAASEAI